MSETAVDCFDILSFEQAGGVSVKFMPSFGKEFYQVIFEIDPANSSIFLNAAKIESSESLLLFQSPHYVYAWRRNFELKGFVLFFNSDFIENFGSFENEFEFFRLTENNLLKIKPEQIAAIKSTFEK